MYVILNKRVKRLFYHSLKGTVRIISRDNQGKDGNARFTTVPLKTLSDKQ